jgi:hypothetical protein
MFCILACKNENHTQIPDPCDNAYDLRSKLYLNLYQGPLPVCPIENKYIRPDNFAYFSPRVNPNNDYEFCYVKKSNKTGSIDLYKYNFCTDKATLITKNVNAGYDWGVKDWVLFVQGNDLWKIKSNGDSLFRIGDSVSPYVAWSPSAFKCFNGSKIFDEKGNVLHEYTLPYKSSYLWESDSTFLYSIAKGINKGFEILRYNIATKVSKSVYNQIDNDGGTIISYNHKDFNLYLYVYQNNQEKYVKINTKTWQSTLINAYDKSKTILKLINSPLKDRFIGMMSLKDTMTGKPCSINYREHIILLNSDGTNERQVLLPE